MPQQLGGVVLPGGAGRDADAGGDPHLLVGAADAERLGQRGEQPVGGRRGPAGVGAVLEQDGELVAAEAGDGVAGPQHPRSRSATATSSSSPAAWPAPSLTALKSSRSTNSTATGVASPVGAGQGVLEPVGEQGAVGQAGQGVVEGVVLELRLELLLRGDVAGRDDDRPDVGIGQQVGVDALHVAVAAVPVTQPQLGGRAGLVAGDGLGAGGEERQPVVGVDQVGQLRADQLVLGVAEQPGDRRASGR